MRTKTLLCLAALIAAGAATSMAQSNVYSLNVVGYVNVTLANGDVLIANPLDAGDNSVSNLFSGLNATSGNNNGYTVFSWTGANFAPNQLDVFGGGWGNPAQQFPPGVGMFVFNGTGNPITNTFVGNVLQGSLTNLLPAGDSLLGSKVPISTNTLQLGLIPSMKDTIFMWNGGNFVPVNFDEFGGGWLDPGDSVVGPVSAANGPVLHIAQGLFYFNSGNNNPAAPTWVINFTVPTP